MIKIDNYSALEEKIKSSALVYCVIGNECCMRCEDLKENILPEVIEQFGDIIDFVWFEADDVPLFANAYIPSAYLFDKGLKFAELPGLPQTNTQAKEQLSQILTNFIEFRKNANK